MSVLDITRTELRGATLTAAAYAAVIVVVLIPLAIALVPPLTDYPNHLAKTFLAIELPHNRYLSEFYEWRLRFVPNLAQDFILPPLARLFGVYDAGRLFLGWSLVQIMLGVCLLRYAVYGHLGLWPLASVLFLYNGVVREGYLNYLFASGLVLILFAGWILMRDRSAAMRMAGFSVLLSMMFFLHLIATALLGLCIGSYQAGRIWRVLKAHPRGPDQWRFGVKEGAASVVPFIPVLILWRLSPTGASEEAFRHAGFLNFADAAFSPFAMSFALSGFFLAIAIFVLAAIGFVFRQVSLAQPLVWPCLCLLLVASLMPAMVLGVFGTHYRIPFVLGCIAVAGIRVRNPKSLFCLSAALLIGALFVARSAQIVAEWHRFDARVQQFRTAIAEIPPGSKVLTALDTGNLESWKGAVRPRSFLHLSALTVVDASAFDPLVFSDPRRQSISVKKRFAYIDVPVGQPPTTKGLTSAFNAASNEAGGSAIYWAHWYRDFDFLIRFSYGYGAPREALAGPLTLMRSGDWFDLYRINRERRPYSR